MTHRRAVWILVGCAFIWGASFTLNKTLLTSVSPMVYVAARFSLGCLLLSPLYRHTTRADWRAGLPLGLLFGLQLSLFAAGLSTTPPARAAFLFSVQTPLVPVLVLGLHRQFPHSREIVAVLVALAGSWLLTRPATGTIGLTRGDFLLLVNAVVAAIYVVAASHVGPRHDPMRLLAVQFVAMASVGLVLALTIETPRFEPNLTTALLLPFLAVSSIASFGGQLLGQKLIRPTEAALIFALEPVVAAITSFVSFGERLSPGQWLGGGLILTAALLVSVRTRIGNSGASL